MLSVRSVCKGEDENSGPHKAAIETQVACAHMHLHVQGVSAVKSKVETIFPVDFVSQSVLLVLVFDTLLVLVFDKH